MATSTKRWRWTRVGETTVEEPDWYTTAANQTAPAEERTPGTKQQTRHRDVWTW
jgi:hypothetical protein